MNVEHEIASSIKAECEGNDLALEKNYPQIALLDQTMIRSKVCGTAIPDKDCLPNCGLLTAIVEKIHSQFNHYSFRFFRP